MTSQIVVVAVHQTLTEETGGDHMIKEWSTEKVIVIQTTGENVVQTLEEIENQNLEVTQTLEGIVIRITEEMVNLNGVT